MTALQADRTTSSTHSDLRNATPLLVGMACLMAGSGLSSTLLGTRGDIEGFSPTVVGAILAAFYLGFVAGSLVAPSTIARVGHVRVFAGLASLGSAAILVHVISPEPISWFVLRAISGMCLSALYVVSETWLNGVATNRTRGTLFAVYMVVVNGSLLGGQLLFTVTDPAGFSAFVVASVLLSLAVVPISLASFAAPSMPDPVPLSLRDLVRVAPLAPVGAALSGLVGSAMLGGGVIYAARAGLDRQATGALIGAALLGGAVLQIPVGRWSDRIDRRFVIVVVSLVASGACLAIATVGPSHRLVVIGLTLVAGGATFPLYALSAAHLNDYLDPALMVSGGARLVLVNGVGAVGGPILGALAVGQIGPGGLFTMMAAAYVILALFAVARIVLRGAVANEDRAEFSPVVVGVGQVATSYDQAPEFLYPPDDGVVEVDGRTISYRDQGPRDVDAVVLLGTPPGRTDPWVEILPAMAWDGLRAISVWNELRPGLPLDAVDVLAVLRELELPWASFVGAGSSRNLVRHLAEEHPDRTDAVVLLQVGGDATTGADRTLEQPEASTHPMLIVDAADWDDAEELADDLADALRRR